MRLRVLVLYIACRYIHLISVIAQTSHEIGDYGYFRNCTFQDNSATSFGAAIAVSSDLVFNNRESFKPTEIINW